MGDARPWTKDWRSAWRDERLDDVGAAGVHLRPCLIAHVVEVGEDGTGWVQNLDGRPLSIAAIAKLVRHTEANTLEGLRDLVTVGIAVVRADGCWGVIGWQQTQETPDAARMRRVRTANASPDSSPTPPEPFANSSPPVQPRGQRTEDRGTEITPTPDAGGRDPTPASPGPEPSLGARLRRARELVGTFTVATAAQRASIPRGLYAQLEANEVLPTCEQLAAIAVALGQPDIATWPLPERDLDLVAGVVRQRRDLGVELGAVDPESPLTPTAHDVAAVYAAEPTDREHGLSLADGWRRVLSRAAEEARREVARGKRWGLEHFTLAELAAAKRRRRLLDAVDLDKRDEPVARGSPGRAPRITAERRYQDKGVPPEKETT